MYILLSMMIVGLILVWLLLLSDLKRANSEIVRLGDDNHELRGLCVGLKMALRRSRDVLSEQDSVIKKLAMSGGKSQISC
jgi:hypothetical protein